MNQLVTLSCFILKIQTADDQILIEEIAKYKDELKNLREKKAALEALENECTTNPVENNLLLFSSVFTVYCYRLFLGTLAKFTELLY